MLRSARKSQVIRPHSVAWLNKGRDLARRASNIAILSNSYTSVRRVIDKADTSLPGNERDLLIGALITMDTCIRHRCGATYTPLKYATPHQDFEPDMLSRGTGRDLPPLSVEEAVPLLLNPEQSTSLDLELGASAGVTPSVVVSPSGPPVSQRKADYEHKGFRVKRKPKSVVAKAPEPATVTTSNPVESPRAHISGAPRSSLDTKADSFKIPLKRRRTPSDVEGTGTDTSGSITLPAWGKPTVPQPRAASLDSMVPSQMKRKKRSGLGAETTTRLRNVGSTHQRSSDADSVKLHPEKRDSESTDSSHAIEQLKRQNEMLGRRLYEIERRDKYGPRQTERRSDRFEQRSRVRNWRCFDRPRYHPPPK